MISRKKVPISIPPAPLASPTSGSTASSPLEFLWQVDRVRQLVLAELNISDLVQLRLVCQDFARMATPQTFKEVSITFRATTFTKPARLAALRSIGPFIRRLSFNFPYCLDSLLPPLLEPNTGSEIEFIYSPDCAVRKPEQSHTRLIERNEADRELADLLIKQYPPLYHAATNVPAFVAAFSFLANLKYLTISCPSQDSIVPSSQSIVDYALISLRIAVERNQLLKLDHLTLSPMQPHVLKLLNPLYGPGSRPNSTRRWRQLKKLTLRMPLTNSQTDLKQLHQYLHALSPNLQSLVFHWLPPTPRPVLTSRPSKDGSQRLSPRRPRSTDTSYFPPSPPPETFHRGANPLTLHLSSFLLPRAPRQKASAKSLPSMTSASTLSSLASEHSMLSHYPEYSDSPSSGHFRQHNNTSPNRRPKLHCKMGHELPTSPPKASQFGPKTSLRALNFPKLAYFELDSISCAATEVAAFIDKHASRLAEFKLEHTTLEPGGGDWDDALAPLAKLTAGEERWRKQSHEVSDREKATNKSQRADSQTKSEHVRHTNLMRAEMKGKHDYGEEVPLILGPELSSPIELSPVKIARFDYPDFSKRLQQAGDIDEATARLGRELGLGGHDQVAELSQDSDSILNSPESLKMEEGEFINRSQADNSPCLSLIAGLPGIEASPLLGMRSGMGGIPLVCGAPLGYYGGGVGMNTGMARLANNGTERRFRTGTKLMSTQRALEDRVRRLLAQTVFPWF